MADAASSVRRRRLIWVLAAIGLVVVFGLAVFLTVLLVRPASPSTSAAPTPTPAAAPTPTPTPGTSGEPAPAASQAQQQQYRAYVSTLIQGGTSVLASMAGLADCRNGRPQCARSLNDASNQVSALQRDLAANPAPQCLAAADQRLQDSLTFQKNGLDTAQRGIRTQNRVQVAQGLLLTAAGLWRSTQAIADGRQANC